MQFIGTGDRILTENFVIGYLYTITFKTGIYSNSACIGIGDNFVMFQRAEPDLLFNLNVNTADEVDTIELYDSGGGTNDYDDLNNRPQINRHTLTGNMSGADLGLQDSISDLDTIRAGAAAGATAVQPANMTTALAAKQDTLSAVQLSAVNSGITSTDVAQITTNKNNILLSLIMPFATNNYNVSNLSVKANANIDTSTGIITQTTTDTQTNLRFQMSAFNGNTLVRYLTDNIIMTNNGVYYLTFTKSSDYNTLVFGHNGSAADFKVALPVSALSNGDYIFKINILNCIQANGAYSFSAIAIVKKTGAYIV